jgi:hypothetical protein
MGTINITRSDIVSVLNNQLPLLATFAGAVGHITADYDDETETLTVDGVTDEDLQTAYDNFPALLASWQPSRSSIQSLKSKAKNQIDLHAGIVRQKYITVSPGQDLTYQEKSEEAADYVAAGYPADLSNYPFIQAEVEATGKTNEQVADDILTQKSAWIVIGAQIEKHRMAGKKQIDDAATEMEIEQAVSSAISLLHGV